MVPYVTYFTGITSTKSPCLKTTSVRNKLGKYKSYKALLAKITSSDAMITIQINLNPHAV